MFYTTVLESGLNKREARFLPTVQGSKGLARPRERGFECIITPAHVYWGCSLSAPENMNRVQSKKARGQTNQRASSPFRSEGLSGSGWGSECLWCVCLDSWSWSWWWCESGLWSPCRTSSSFSRMSFSVSLSATPGTAGRGKSVPLSLVSLLRSCRVQHLIFKVFGGKQFQ